jgi:hypothetical protein
VGGKAEKVFNMIFCAFFAVGDCFGVVALTLVVLFSVLFISFLYDVKDQRSFIWVRDFSFC